METVLSERETSTKQKFMIRKAAANKLKLAKKLIKRPQSNKQ